MSKLSKETLEIYAKIKAACRSGKMSDEDVRRPFSERAVFDGAVVPTPIARLNACLGVGGIPFGRIVEIYGTESSGKTTLALELVAEAQKRGISCGFIDMEHSLDPNYARTLGVDLDSVFFVQPGSGNEALANLEIMANSGIRLLIMDSVPALVGRDEYEKSPTDSQVGVQARMLSQFCRRAVPILGRTGTALVMINQMREKIGVMFGNPETTPGGKALRFYATMRIEMRGTSDKDSDGRVSTIKVVKNKLGSPFRECTARIIYGKGFDRFRDAVEFGKELGVIQGKSWLTLPKLGTLTYPEGDVKFQGTDAAIEFVERTPGYFELLRDACQKAYFNRNTPIETPEVSVPGPALGPDEFVDPETGEILEVPSA